MGHDMLKWLVNYLSNKLALCLYKGEFRFKVSERKYNMAANENFGHLFEYLEFLYWAKLDEVMKHFYFLQTIIFKCLSLSQ